MRVAKTEEKAFRDILKLMQSAESSGLGFTVDGIEKAAIMSGMQA